MAGVLDAVGRTPLVELDQLFPDVDLRLHAKLESLNPGGSIKDRPALAIIREGLRTGAITPETVVVESSSGNMGVGLAQACRYHGLKLICVVDPKTAPQNLKVLQAYGATIERVREPDPESGEFLQARIRRVQELVRTLPLAYWPNQYENAQNPTSHYQTTMAEVVEQLGTEVDFVFAATSTCGTVRGCGEFIRDRRLRTKLIAVDAVGSQIFSDVKKKRSIPGLGASLRPPLCDVSLIEETIHVNDAECVAGCRLLVEREAILAGGSSGGVVAALARARRSLPRGACCVLILCDRGERYLDTVYDDAWVREHCGEVTPLDDDLPGEVEWAAMS